MSARLVCSDCGTSLARQDRVTLAQTRKWRAMLCLGCINAERDRVEARGGRWKQWDLFEYGRRVAGRRKVVSA